MRPLLAALLGAVAIFVWLAVAHMFTPLGEAGLGYLPKEDAVSDALTSSIGAQPGMYMFPTGGLTKESSNAEKEKGMERMMEEMKTKPSGMLIYKPAGTTFNFGKCLAIEFLTDGDRTRGGDAARADADRDVRRTCRLRCPNRRAGGDRRERPALELV